MNIPALQKWLMEPRTSLVAAVAEGVRAHVNTLRARGVEFYGYALLPGEPNDIHSLVAATNTEADIRVSRSDGQYRYCRYSVDEWAHYDHDVFVTANALLVEANRQFKSMHSKEDDDCMMDEFEVAHTNILLGSIVQGIDVARASGVFGSKEPFLIVWISDSGTEVMVESARRLNPAAVATEFIREFGP